MRYPLACAFPAFSAEPRIFSNHHRCRYQHRISFGWSEIRERRSLYASVSDRHGIPFPSAAGEREMRMIEITRTDDASVADQMTEMNEWLRERGIQPFQLEAIQIEEA